MSSASHAKFERRSPRPTHDADKYRAFVHRATVTGRLCIVFDEMQAGGALILSNKKMMQAHLDGATPVDGADKVLWSCQRMLPFSPVGATFLQEERFRVSDIIMARSVSDASVALGANKIFWPCQKMLPVFATFTDVFKIGSVVGAKMAREVRCFRFHLEFQADTGGHLCGPVVDTRRFFFRNCPTVSFPILSLWNSKRMRGGAFVRLRGRYKAILFSEIARQ